MRRLLPLCVIPLLLALTFVGGLQGCKVFANNLRTVTPGQFYRSAQMSGGRLEWTIRRHDIKVVVNLRGVNTGEKWYDEEIAACARMGVTHTDFDWTGDEPPEPAQLLRFLDILDTSPRPILVHCQGGTHRAGVASALYVLHEGGSPDEARDQFGVFFNNARIGCAIDLYEASALSLREWAEKVYPTQYAEWMAKRAEGE